MGRRRRKILYVKVKPGDGYERVGTIRWNARDCETEFWFECDGRVMWISDYPELYNEIGTTFGQGVPGTFFLPDQAKIHEAYLNVA